MQPCPCPELLRPTAAAQGTHKSHQSHGGQPSAPPGRASPEAPTPAPPFPALLHLLPRVTSLRVLNISGTGLCVGDLDQLLQGLEVSALEELNLSKLWLGPEAVPPVARLLAVNTGLQGLNMSEWRLKDKGLAAVAQGLGRNRYGHPSLPPPPPLPCMDSECASGCTWSAGQKNLVVPSVVVRLGRLGSGGSARRPSRPA